MGKQKSKLNLSLTFLIMGLLTGNCKESNNPANPQEGARPNDNPPPPSGDSRSNPILETVPLGFTNFGNTCYVNAALKALLNLKGFRDYLENPLPVVSEPIAAKEALLLALQNLARVYRGVEEGKSSSSTHFYEELRAFFLAHDACLLELPESQRKEYFVSATEPKANGLRSRKQGDSDEFTMMLADLTRFADSDLSFGLCVLGLNPNNGAIQPSKIVVLGLETDQDMNQAIAESTPELCQSVEGLTPEFIHVLIPGKRKTRLLFDRPLALSFLPHPEQLNEAKEQRLEYEPQAFVIHGGSSKGGHYLAYIKDPKTQVWYEHNDTLVTKLDSDEKVSLMWKRVEKEATIVQYGLIKHKANPQGAL